jgi:hypothetical protein
LFGFHFGEDYPKSGSKTTLYFELFFGENMFTIKSRIDTRTNLPLRARWSNDEAPQAINRTQCQPALLAGFFMSDPHMGWGDLFQIAAPARSAMLLKGERT